MTRVTAPAGVPREPPCPVGAAPEPPGVRSRVVGGGWISQPRPSAPRPRSPHLLGGGGGSQPVVPQPPPPALLAGGGRGSRHAAGAAARRRPGGDTRPRPSRPRPRPRPVYPEPRPRHRPGRACAVGAGWGAHHRAVTSWRATWFIASLQRCVASSRRVVALCCIARLGRCIAQCMASSHSPSIPGVRG